MRILNFFYILLLLATFLLLVKGQRPDFLNLKRKYHRHHCPHRRCMPLHSRVPFP
ncbi:apelin receptor early endogenous ligand [Paramormyrops kingsleyae]|uniref:Apelin receptor early endogenous ligand n=1 Tax=Paramormyrops kingsleyae TaxID=1676925 RepID=A0A3B3Q7F9_9TELE|nr:apelin receptor early endogenous ligand [Paramormyrops kingsleyae]